MTSLTEEWRPIPGYETTYAASTLGRIARISSGGLRPKKPTPNCKNNYLYVQLWQHNQMAAYTVHSLVARTFHGPCPEGMEVSHLDGNKHNCQPGNLKYETRAENAARKTGHGTALTGTRNHQAKLTEDDVRQIRADADAGRSHESLAREYGVSRPAIGFVARRVTWSHIA